MAGTLIRGISRDQAGTPNLLCGMLLATATWSLGAWSTARASIHAIRSHFGTTSSRNHSALANRFSKKLQLAVETATYGHPDRAEAEKDTKKEKQNRADHVERMAMVRHLLDVVGLDV